VLGRVEDGARVLVLVTGYGVSDLLRGRLCLSGVSVLACGANGVTYILRLRGRSGRVGLALDGVDALLEVGLSLVSQSRDSSR
jgi:hypothetical protein